MTLQKKTIAPLILVMFTVICALPAAGTVPSAIAQEEDDMSLNEEEGGGDLASGTVSNVLDSGSTAGDNTNTQLSVPLIDHDQRDANLGLSEALDVIVERTLSTPPPDDDGLPPEDDTVFCIERQATGETLCFDTRSQCETAKELLGIVLAQCEEFETPPPGAESCSIVVTGGQAKIQCNN